MLKNIYISIHHLPSQQNMKNSRDAIGSNSDDPLAPPPKRRRTNPARGTESSSLGSARTRRVKEAADRKAAAAAAEAALAENDCADEEEPLQLAYTMSITAAAAATPTASTPALHVNIHGFPLVAGHLLPTANTHTRFSDTSISGAPPANIHTRFSDNSGDDDNDDDDEDGDGDDDGDDDDKNASNPPATAGLFHGLLAHPAIAAMVDQIPSSDPAAPVGTTVPVPPPSPPLDSAVAMHGHCHDSNSTTPQPRRPALSSTSTDTRRGQRRHECRRATNIHGTSVHSTMEAPGPPPPLNMAHGAVDAPAPARRAMEAPAPPPPSSIHNAAEASAPP